MESEALSYWMSPSARTAERPAPTSKSDVYFWRQAVEVPLPFLKLLSAGSQAMSPAAAMTGSAARAEAAPSRSTAAESAA